MTRASEYAIRRSIAIDVPRVRAFEIFVNMTAWWPLTTHTAGEAPAQAWIVEPRVGGRWFSIDKFGDEDDVGHVLAYDPPRRIVLAWQLSHEFAYDPASQTELDVRFISESPARTRVELEHRRFEAYGARSREQRKLYEGDHAWAFILRCYAGAAPGISRP